MRTHRQTFPCVLIGLGLGLTGGCSGRSLGSSAPDVVVSGAGSGAADTSANTPGLGANANANPDPIVNGTPSPPVKDMCEASMPFKVAGCPCQTGDTTSCWMGPANKRNTSTCHDGTQRCVGTNEFASWGACEGQELNCVDPPPPPTKKCGCVPGAVIECDEDCSVSIFCSFTAEKTCQPDGTWAPCRETSSNAATALLADGGLNAILAQLGPDGGLAASLRSITGDAGLDSGLVITPPAFSIDGKCRSMYHGCDSSVFPREQYAGDCSAAFSCGHAPTAPE